MSKNTEIKPSDPPKNTNPVHMSTPQKMFHARLQCQYTGKIVTTFRSLFFSQKENSRKVCEMLINLYFCKRVL